MCYNYHYIVFPLTISSHCFSFKWEHSYMACKRPLSISIPSLPFTHRYCILYHCTSAYLILQTEVIVHSIVNYKCPCKKLLLNFVMFEI
jgi:hypothetical protein